MGKKANSVTIGYKYYLGMHMGLCRGEIDKLLEIKVGDRTAWTGEMTESGEFRINKPNLFGGTKAEGGVDGDCWLMLGEPGMSVPGKIRGWLGGLVPGFKGVTTMFFDGMVSAMSPYPKPWKMKVTRIFRGWDQGVWYPEKASILMDGVSPTGKAQTIEAMNPAHIIYQCCVDRNWGRGMPRSLIDGAAFRQAADTLFDEGFGLCIAWNRQDTLDSFVQNLLDHIGGVLYVDKQTGLFKIKLIRFDYIKSNLPLYDVNTGLLSIEESSLSSGTETVNEIVVKWYDPISNQESSVRSQNLASIQTNKATYSRTNTYIGVPTAHLAQRLADRDIKYSSVPLRTFQLTFDRRAWRVQPGDVVRIQDPTRGQIDIVIRISEVDDGVLTDGRIKIVAVEDVFTMPLDSNVQAQPPLWNPPDYTPALARRVWYEVPYANLNALFPRGEFNFIEFDAGYYGMGVEKATPLSMAYNMDMRPNGTPWIRDGFGDFVAVGETVSPVNYLDREITIDNISDLFDEVVFPCAAIIGAEVIIVEGASIMSGTSSRTLSVRRGTYDTRPHRHPGGEEVWFYENSIGSNWTEYVGGDIVDAKALPWTFSGGDMDAANAPIDTVEMNWRFSRPYVPGYMRVQGRPWYEHQVLDRDNPALNFSWTHRDRVQQQDQMIPHEMGNIGPEPGSSYLVRVYAMDGELLRTESGLQGTSWNYLWAQAVSDLGIDISRNDDEYGLIIRLWTFREGLESWQYYQVTVTVKDLAIFLQVAKYGAQIMQESEFGPADGVSVAKFGAQVAQESDLGIAAGLSVSKYGALVNQLTVLTPPVDKVVLEFPYINLLRKELPANASRVMTFSARPEDRITDGHDLFTAKANVTGEEGDLKYTLPEKENWNDAGPQPWTPWFLLDKSVDYLDETLEYTSSSELDGVPLGLKVGSLIYIGDEIVVVKAFSSGVIEVGRGTSDTIPHQHRAKTKCWVFSVDHGADTVTYGDEDYVGVKIRPHVHTPTKVDLDKVNEVLLPMAYRYTRPYPPGLMMANGFHWYEQAIAFTSTGRGQDREIFPKSVEYTWKHRDRVQQEKGAVDHWVGNIGPEVGVQYRVQVSFYLPSRVPGEKGQAIVLRSAIVDGTSWTYASEWAIPDGFSAARMLSVPGQHPICGSVRVTVKIDAIRGDVVNWQGYVMGLTLPAPNCPTVDHDNSGGDSSGGGNSGGSDSDSGGGSGDGSGDSSGDGSGDGSEDGSGDGDDIKRPDPEDPYEEEDDEDEEPKPDEPDPTDPEEPDGGHWGERWDKNWAADLPDGWEVGDDVEPEDDDRE